MCDRASDVCNICICVHPSMRSRSRQRVNKGGREESSGSDRTVKGEAGVMHA